MKNWTFRQKLVFTVSLGCTLLVVLIVLIEQIISGEVTNLWEVLLAFPIIIFIFLSSLGGIFGRNTSLKLRMLALASPFALWTYIGLLGVLFGSTSLKEAVFGGLCLGSMMTVIMLIVTIPRWFQKY